MCPRVGLAERFSPREPPLRKGDRGRVVILGGSERYSGAPAFNGLAALRAGADLAVVVAPRRAADVVATFSPDLITIPCDTAWPDPRAAADEVGRADAVVLGGGVERSEGAHEALRDAIRACGKPLVLDAEAVHALRGHEDALRGKTALLTPHGGEFEAWRGEPPTDDAMRRAVARVGAGCAVLVKRPPVVVVEGTRRHVDQHGSPFMTKGGYGDLLAGAAGAFLARGASPFDAGVAAAELVGRAGTLAGEALGESALASDALARFADVLRAP